MTADSYMIEVENFRKYFGAYKRKKIVLYGIGRYTATLVPAVKDFNIIGLMDKDESKIGTNMYGMPIISKAEAEKNADIIVINTSGSYWDIIYERIENLNLTIYYRNGKKAVKKEKCESRNLLYWDEDKEKLYQTIKEYDIVSFDIYDTLIIRKTGNHKDVFEWLSNFASFPYQEVRNQAVSKCSENASLNEIYKTMQQISGIDENEKNFLMKQEIKREMSLVEWRKDMLDVLKKIMEQYPQKEIFFLSDMYLSGDFFTNLFTKSGIQVRKSQIWISCEIKANKKTGTMWELYKKRIVKGKKAIHVGDSYIADVEEPKKNGISAFYIMNKNDMANSTFLKMIDATSLYESTIMGLVENKLFNSPFAMHATKGKIFFRERKQFGYVVLGPVILTFLVWLINKCKEKKSIYFLARDGFFLEKNYAILSQIYQDKLPKAVYLYTSRLLATIAGMEEGSELLLQLPYNGTLRSYLEDRYSILAEEDDKNLDETVPQYRENCEKLKKMLIPYEKDIAKKIEEVKKNYHKYLFYTVNEEKPVFVDISYYGHTQEMLSHILNRKTEGYYFVADLSEQNECNKKNKMYACFQKKSDLYAEESSIHNKCLMLESFLTAPYGMIRGIDKSGQPVCEKKRDNQIFFADKEEINDGIKEFIMDVNSIFELEHYQITEQDRVFFDKWYGLWSDETSCLQEEIKRSFYNDNALVHRESNRVIE